MISLINFVLGAWIVFCAISAIAWIAALFLKLEAACACPQPRTSPSPPAMSDKAFFKVAYSSCFWRLLPSRWSLTRQLACSALAVDDAPHPVAQR